MSKRKYRVLLVLGSILTAFFVPMGEVRQNSCRVCVEFISGKLLHISYLSVLFVWLLSPSAVVTPSGSGRIVPSPLGDSSANDEQSSWKGIGISCASSLPELFWLKTENHAREVS